MAFNTPRHKTDSRAQIVASLKHIAVTLIALCGTMFGAAEARADVSAAQAFGHAIGEAVALPTVIAARADVGRRAASAVVPQSHARVVTVATKRCDRMPSHSCDETCEQLLRPSATQHQARQKFALGHRAGRVSSLGLALQSATALGLPSGRAEFLIGDGASPFKRMFAKTSRLLS